MRCRRGLLHPRRYPKLLVFHDGCTVFRPTPSVTLGMFVWLPFGAPVAVLCTAIFLLITSLPKDIGGSLGDWSNHFACNHQSLLDPLCVSAAAGRRDLAAATYNISCLSEMLSPIPTFRLTRDRATNRAAMQAHLARRRRP